MSDDYTPNTRLVRNSYIAMHSRNRPEDRILEGEFDRWLSSELAAARRAGREEQREADAVIADGCGIIRSALDTEYWEGYNNATCNIAATIRSTEIGEN